MYKYLLWDVDGTILDFLASEAYAIKTLFRKYKIGECSDEMLKTYSRINIKYWELLEKNKMSKEEILVGRFREFFEIIGVDQSIAESFNQDYQVTLGDNIEFIKNAKEVLLEQKGRYILVAVTNGTKVAQSKKLRLSGLDKIFDEVFISEDVGVEKPNKGFFDYVFDKMNIFDKSQVLLIGDSLTSDMKGGMLAGIDTCWYNPWRQQNPKSIPVTYEIEDLKEVENILNKKSKKVKKTIDKAKIMW